MVDGGGFLSYCNHQVIKINKERTFLIKKFKCKNKLQKNYAYNICLKYITSNTERNN